MAELLSVRGLSVSFGDIAVLRDVDLDVQPGEILGVVGESGSGKSTLIGAILRTLPSPAVITSGEVRLRGQDMLAATDQAVRAHRWRDVSVVPQSALDALNPVLSIRRQLVDTVRTHRPTWPLTECHARAEEAIASVGIHPGAIDRYPHELSGGMRQRVAIALALILEPPLVILDEPTTALDVLMEGRIVRLLLKLRARHDFAMIFVTHDLPLLLSFATRMAVLYAGRVVETGPTGDVAHTPAHPYTRALLGAIPRVDGPRGVPQAIGGQPPSFADPPAGCRFHPRCPIRGPACQREEPALRGGTHRVACVVDA